MRYEISPMSSNEDSAEWWDIIDTVTGDILLGAEQETEEDALALVAELNAGVAV